MEGGIGTGDDRTFRVNFSCEGVSKLRDNVKQKLNEYMGDYTDDTLVEYVIVLLKNGRRKDEARNELNVFLGDDSDAFVSWLWDHLGSFLNLYVQPWESQSDGVKKTVPVSVEQGGGNDSHQIEPESVKLKPSNSFKSRHSREWKELDLDAGVQPRLRSTLADSIHADKESRKVGHETQSAAPQTVVRRKRDRPEERPQNKKEVESQMTIAAPRRLLQFAVRDAVATSRPSGLNTETSSKRLRSVVSTCEEDSNLEERPQRIRSVAKVSNAMAAAIKAVAEAAKDVRRVRSSGNVFDRLGRATDVSETLNQGEFGEDDVEDEERIYSDTGEQGKSNYDQRNDYLRPYVSDVPLSRRDTRMVIDPASDNDDYDVKIMRHGVVDVSQTGTSGGKRGEDSSEFQHTVANNADEIVNVSFKNGDQVGENSHTSHKIVNASVNLNTWKSPQYQELRESLEVDNQKSVAVNEALTSFAGVNLIKKNSNPVVVANGNAKLEVNVQKESQKNQSSAPGLHPIGRPTEDADSRTVFVNNVHFAAAKDSLSQHFSKFGEVSKVIILTDVATGQPKGSAYVEFMKKEAAENALSLDGTSFMSRILRVVRKSSAQPEASSITNWPRIARGYPYAVSRFGRVPFPRGIPGVYRSRLPTKPGGRSFQWKRVAQSTLSETYSPAFSSTAPSSTRSLTYVRTEHKTDGSSSAA
ncbi:hypothetical protein ACH5RR_000749 [Cinchona calisaya]|uniref:RRM domain-containing protein n=1 Tax=Cinchona calisaya TaxID=153742 RepID=A0ABD3B1L6_9GENT